MSEKRPIQQKFPEISGICGEKLPKISVNLANLSSYPEISGDVVSFFTGKFHTFKLEFFIK